MGADRSHRDCRDLLGFLGHAGLLPGPEASGERPEALPHGQVHLGLLGFRV